MDWVAHASRVSGDSVPAIANFSYFVNRVCDFRLQKRLSRRDAETSTRDACATQSGANQRNSRCNSVDDLEAHLAGGAGNDAEGGVFVARIQVFGLGLNNFHHLFARHFTDLGLIRFLGTGSNVGSLFQ
jgi:hypothetical protein